MNALVLAFNLWVGAEAARVDFEHPAPPAVRQPDWRRVFQGYYHPALAQSRLVTEPDKLLWQLSQWQEARRQPHVETDLFWDRNEPALRKRQREPRP